MTLKPQDRLAHYRLVEVLGEGGMGVVWRASDTRLGRDVALKPLAPESVGDQERRLRFLREARTAAAVSHPSIAAIYEIAPTDVAGDIDIDIDEGLTQAEKALALPVHWGAATTLATEYWYPSIQHARLQPRRALVQEHLRQARQ